MTTDPLHRLQQLLAADTVPIRDGAGIIIPSAVDAAHRAAAYRRAINALTPDSTNEVDHVKDTCRE